MEQNLQHTFLKKFLRKEEEGFSLIELVVVVAVLSILSAIAIPTFNCFQRKAKAATALAALRQINSECSLVSINNDPTVFTSSNLHSYSIQSGNQAGNCEGNDSSGLISATPENTNVLPTFNLWTGSGILTYSFKGKVGNDFDNCFSLICGIDNSIATTTSNSGQEEENNNNNIPKKCNYIHQGDDNSSLNLAKWLLHQCEEYIHKVELCQHPYAYANPEDAPHNFGPPFPFVPCSSLCGSLLDESSDPRCGENAYKAPSWLSGDYDWSLDAHTDGNQNNKDALIKRFEEEGYFNYD